MRIVLPWPPTALSANGSQGDFRGKARAAKAYKADCVALCREQGKGLRSLPAPAIVANVSLTFCPPSGRRYDLDNMLKRMKHGLDAVAEAIGVDDADWRSMTLLRGDPSKSGGVIVEINPTHQELIP
ncbi:RusA family crossover junction endodeoxyribonuclease [Falsigemmobacter faecalis]|uniref:Uncharacterized protein n=1 Tax=Falsigemmobacter faecalis TaxID=2488730 RepID=A0A3P3DEE2_9RHOB|nr:hypothetical protein [Falsigemmobacter faecalis]RRH72016.1 hypothetical protein EG244_16000 [Falsigemmobacter faecalis]